MVLFFRHATWDLSNIRVEQFFTTKVEEKMDPYRTMKQ